MVSKTYLSPLFLAKFNKMNRRKKQRLWTDTFINLTMDISKLIIFARGKRKTYFKSVKVHHCLSIGSKTIKKHAQVTCSSKPRQISYMSVLMDENIWEYSSGLYIYHFKLDAVVVLFHSTRIRYFDRLFNWHERVWWKCVRKSTTGCNKGRIMTKQCWKDCSACPVQYVLTG